MEIWQKLKEKNREMLAKGQAKKEAKFQESIRKYVVPKFSKGQRIVVISLSIASSNLGFPNRERELESIIAIGLEYNYKLVNQTFQEAPKVWGTTAGFSHLILTFEKES